MRLICILDRQELAAAPSNVSSWHTLITSNWSDFPTGCCQAAISSYMSSTNSLVLFSGGRLTAFHPHSRQPHQNGGAFHQTSHLLLQQRLWQLKVGMVSPWRDIPLRPLVTKAASTGQNALRPSDISSSTEDSSGWVTEKCGVFLLLEKQKKNLIRLDEGSQPTFQTQPN